ncbi:MAG: hypothetical protein QW292_02865 [Candidatus Parvarchaeota archaeon]
MAERIGRKENPFIKQFKERKEDIAPIEMKELEHLEIREFFLQFIEFLTENVVKESRVKILFWGDNEAVLELEVYSDFTLNLDNAGRKIRGASIEGKYAFAIPYSAVDSVYVSTITGKTPFILLS